jgi:hypothetical protein
MKFSKFYCILKRINEMAGINKYSRIKSYLRFFYLAVSKQYSPVEIFMEDLLNPSWSANERSGMISKERFLHLQEQVNPASHRYLTEDKIAFHHHCVKNGLAVPELVAILDADGGSCWGDGKKIKTEHDLQSGLARFPFGIVAKPVHGYHGNGVLMLNFAKGKHYLANDLDQPLLEIFKKILNENADKYILQRMLYSHQDIMALTGNEVLQSLRLVTYLNDDGQPRLIIRKIKLPKKGSLIDNFSWGVNEGRLCLIDEKGQIESTVKLSPEEKHLVRYDHVQDINGNNVEFRIPSWEQCVSLVLNAQKAFAPLLTIGWDVAVTDDGPFLIEGNVFWDPLKPQEGSMRDICRLLIKRGKQLAV